MRVRMIVALHAEKRGTGKTTLATNLAGMRESAGQRVLSVDGAAFSELGVAVTCTPDDPGARIRETMELTEGFGSAIEFVHDWANRENTRRRWDMVVRYVIPQVNGLLDDY